MEKLWRLFMNIIVKSSIKNPNSDIKVIIEGDAKRICAFEGGW